MNAPGCIAVCVKPAWRTDTALRLDPAGRSIRPDGAEPVFDPAAHSALHLALQLKATLDPPPTVLALTLGPPAWDDILRQALAHGADEVLRVWHPEWPPTSADVMEGSAARTRHAATALAPLLHTRAPALVLTGERSGDAGHECFGAFLAHALGAAFAHRATQVAPADAGWQVQVKLERGYGQDMTVPTPAVVTVSAQAGRPGYPALPAWLASRRATVPHMAPASAALPAGHSTLRPPVPRVKRYHVPPDTLSAEDRIRAMVAVESGGGGAQLGASEPPEQKAEAVLRLLRERGYL